jgi:glutamate formiminotransferase / 5-formyltetrahydrofolate cyclo-ligase
VLGKDTMPPRLFEAVPNFSEGRDGAKISRIADSVRNTPGVRVLDLHSDPDHNRSVLTFVGEEEPLLRASAALARACVHEIDLTFQSGVHPRVGSLDVLPFVPMGPPLSDATLEDAARVARRAGEAIGSLGLPVYLYGAATRAPHRENLAEIRRGGYEGLEARIDDPLWRPDYGPRRLPPRSGAVAVGARPFLVAFNAYLDTDDLEVARAIAGEVRERDGGLPGVKALGLEVGRRAQVSMNLTDLERTSIPTALEAVRKSAERHGARVEATELVGLMPMSAVLEAARHYLTLTKLGSEHVLEAALWIDWQEDSPKSFR